MNLYETLFNENHRDRHFSFLEKTLSVAAIPCMHKQSIFMRYSFPAIFSVILSGCSDRSVPAVPAPSWDAWVQCDDIKYDNGLSAAVMVKKGAGLRATIHCDTSSKVSHHYSSPSTACPAGKDLESIKKAISEICD